MEPSVLAIAVTGHRPADLFGYDLAHPGWCWVREELRGLVREFANGRACRFLSGLALGVDQVFADVVLESGQELVGFVPFEGQDRIWPASSQREYARLRAACSQVRVVGEVPCREAFLRRNDAMVEQADVVVAVWGGKESGGTWHCLQSALAAGRIVVWLDPFARRVRVVA